MADLEWYTSDPVRNEIRRLRLRLQQAEEMVANVVEHCYQSPRLHCSACQGSLEVALEVLRAELPSDRT
jgi:hypothetical protein